MGVDSSTMIERSTRLIWRAGLHLSLRMSRQMRPTRVSEFLVTEFVDVGVVDLGAEEDLGGHHGVLLRQEELAVEHAALVGGVGRARNLHEEVAVVLLAGLHVNAHNYRVRHRRWLRHRNTYWAPGRDVGSPALVSAKSITFMIRGLDIFNYKLTSTAAV